MTQETDQNSQHLMQGSSVFSKESRAEHVATIIRNGISSGFWRPGDTINDQALASDLGVSRTSVREALSRLVESRVVERVQ